MMRRGREGRALHTGQPLTRLEKWETDEEKEDRPKGYKGKGSNCSVWGLGNTNRQSKPMETQNQGENGPDILVNKKPINLKKPKSKTPNDTRSHLIEKAQTLRSNGAEAQNKQ